MSLQGVGLGICNLCTSPAESEFENQGIPSPSAKKDKLAPKSTKKIVFCIWVQRMVSDDIELGVSLRCSNRIQTLPFVYIP